MAAKHQTRTPSGTLAHIRIDGRLHRKHFPHGTDPERIRRWLLTTELKYRGRKAKRTGRFRDDAAAYLETVKGMASIADRRTHINEWVEVFGDQLTDTITSDEITAQLHRWRTEPRVVTVTRRATSKAPVTKTIVLSASSVNKRRTALMHLFTVLFGKAERNPVKDTPKFREPSPLPKGLPYPLIRQLWAVMADTPSRARLQVMAYTGLPNKLIAQLTPESVDWEGSAVVVPGRQKGAGTEARRLPLTKDGLKAMRAMQRTDAWGPFNRSSLRRVFREACARVPELAPLADRLTPYDLRHSFGTEVYRSSGDIRATQVLMMHATPALTHRYTLAAVDPRLVDALKRFGRRR